ncbi:tyrosine-type recombinase/integrase [Cellulomonas sp. APG4]|uniref:tyrosine-type recombinase/integrase n=1 Tax=Cellulomonas sp. APG4 TaxID=1538656 RepID=UPI001379A3D9|nr:tyrosine-type recombinase/integrase [Cellulomonas sp. APG4]NCT91950.1 tyrosine-type recombinase/integrase [Cellulomonas sp. APG4]
MSTGIVTSTAADPGDVELVESLPVLTDRQKALITEALEHRVASGTFKSYSSSWRTWVAWCEDPAVHPDGQPHTPLPAHPLSVSAWVTERADAGMSVSTITKDLAAIRFFHEQVDLDDPTSNRGVRMVMAGLRRKAIEEARPTKKAHPLTTVEIRRIVAKEHIDRRTLRGKRDVAIILTGFAGALRRSELAGLHVSDVEFKGSDALITLRKSKGQRTSTTKKVIVGITAGHDPQTDPVLALRRWIRAAGISGEDFLFQRIAPGAEWVTIPTGVEEDGTPKVNRMTGQAIAEILTARAKAAGLDDIGITGHSLRRGHATAAGEAGVDPVRLARTTRHKNLETLAQYIEPAQVLGDTTARELGL